MGHIVPLHHPLRLAEELAIADQMLGGRLEIGLVPGILPAYFAPFKVDYASRREVTLEFARFLKAVYTERSRHSISRGNFTSTRASSSP